MYKCRHMKTDKIVEILSPQLSIKSTKSARQIADEIHSLYTTEIIEEEIRDKFHSEYATPKDENYAIEYDAYMAGHKAALSKSAKGVRVVTRCKCPMCGEKFSPSDHAIHTERT